MESRYYKCKYCFKEFEPKRRRVQKYCSDTCRNKAHHAKKPKHVLPAVLEESLPATEIKPELKPQKEKVTFAGVTEATTGSLIADSLKAFVTKEENKSATKKDLRELKSLIMGSRYLPVTNLEPNQFGQYPYYDVEIQELVYL